MRDDSYALSGLIRDRFAAGPEQLAVQYDGRWFFRREISALALALDNLLDEAGVEREFAVGLVLRNRPAAFAALSGLVAAARTVVLISPFQSPQSIAADIAKLNLRAVVAVEQDWAAETIASAREAASTCIALDGISLTARRLAESAAWGKIEHLRLPGIAVQMLTSGTTGAPKRVPLSRPGLSQAIADQVRMSAVMGESPPEAGLKAVLVQYAPMVQLSGLYTALQAASEGKPLVLMDKFSAELWSATIRDCRPTMAALPPAMMRMVLEANPPPEDLASLLAVRSGAAPLDAQTRDTFEQRYGARVLSIYGATEFVGPVASWSLADRERFGAMKRGSVGRIWPDIAQARVMDPESGEILAPGISGVLELQVGRAGPDWIKTNDLATLDSEGFLFIHGRADDAINRGGFKIPPDVIADALRTHPSVYDAAAVPLPDARLGQVPAAAVELRPGAEPVTEAALMAYARGNLIAYQVPVRILVVPELPRTPAQKISRPGVRKLFLDPAG